MGFANVYQPSPGERERIRLEALRELRDAIRQRDLCRTDSEKAASTGATLDAIEWIESAARKVVANG